jgi:MscS family membrane protein
MHFLDNIFFDNSVRSLLTVILIISTGLICKKWLSRNLASVMFLIIKQKWISVDKNVFVDLVFKPLGTFLSVLISILSLMYLNFPAVLKFNINGYAFDGILTMISKSIIIIYFIIFLRSFINFISFVLDLKAKQSNEKSDDQLIVFFRDFAKAVVSIFGILMVLKFGFKVDVGAVLTGLSIVGAALALAAKESIENLIASFIIFFDKPFFIGDFVKVNNQTNATGTIEEIGLRSTRIRTVEHTLITVPNKQMVDSVVDNWSMRNARRAEIKIELSHNNELKSINEFIQLLETHLKSKPETISKSTVYLTDYTKSGTILTLEYFTSDLQIEHYFALKQNMIIYIKQTIETTDLKLANAGGDINIFNTDSGGNVVNNNSII